jgi:hypothetical protein
MARTGGSFAFLVVLTCAGCGGQPPTGQMPTMPSVPAALPGLPTRQPLRLIGRVVDSQNNGVAGAKLTSWSDRGDTQMTDAAGAFEMIVSVRPDDRSFWLTVEKGGYETSELARAVEEAGAALLRLHSIRSIAAGESLQLVINPDDSACGYHWGYICRRVRVRAELAGRLELQVVSDVAGVGFPVGLVGFPQTFERRISASTEAGSEITVEVAAPLGVRAPFTLNTSLTAAR